MAAPTRTDSNSNHYKCGAVWHKAIGPTGFAIEKICELNKKGRTKPTHFMLSADFPNTLESINQSTFD